MAIKPNGLPFLLPSSLNMDDKVKRKPAPRMFCDICDLFDAHETEDCPVQGSDSPPLEPAAPVPPMQRNADGTKVLPQPRKYCTKCEVFGHDADECDADECY